VSARNGKITPMDVPNNPLAMLIAGWRAKADTAAAQIDTPYALARAAAFRDCAHELERVLSGVAAIIHR
jgi:hypothetical protein